MSGGRKYIGVMFECCRAYQRIYVNRKGDAYEGRCPRCMRLMKIRIAPYGTKDRFFRAH